MSEAFDEDGVDLLTRDLPPARAQFARRLTTALRLLASDASGTRTDSAAVHPARAAAELAERRGRLEYAALGSVVRHLLRAGRVRGSFLQVERPARDHTASWAALLALVDAPRRAHLGLEVPLPGTPRDVALEGLLAALARLAEGLGRVEEHAVRHLALVHRALVQVAGDGIDRDLRRAFDALAQDVHAIPRAGARSLRRAVLVDAIAIALDGRRMREVEPLLARLDPLPERAPDCATAGDALLLLARWFVRGDVARPHFAPETVRRLGFDDRAWAEFARVLDGDPAAVGHAEERGAGPAAPAVAPSPARLDRRAVGARAVCVCRIDESSGRVRVVAAECAPALSGAVDAWGHARRDALRERGAPEHEMVRRTSSLAWCSAGDAGAHDVLSRVTLGAGGASGDAVPPPRSLCVVPLLDAGREVRGFVWVEADHALFPSPEQRAHLARVGGAFLEPGRCAGAALCPPGPRTLPAASTGGEATARADLELEPDPDLARAWVRAVEGLQLKLAERRWLAFHRIGEAVDSLVPVASGGEGELGGLDATNDRRVRRAFRTGGAIHDAATAGESTGPYLWGRAASGVVLPLWVGGRVVAALVLESARRGDFRPADVERWDAALEASAPAIAVAAVDARDRRAARGGFAFDPTDPSAGPRFERLAALSRARTDLCIVGPRGAGRATLARALGHLAQIAQGRGRVRTVSAASLAPVSMTVGSKPSEGFERRLEGDRADVVVLEDVGELDDGLVRALGLHLARSADRPRVIATAEGDRPPAFARVLGAAALRVPALARRRTQILPIAHALLARAAREDGDLPPGLTDDAAALLWRQPWEGQCAELGSVLKTAYLQAGGGQVDAAAVRHAIEENGLEVVPRLASREPDPITVAQALWVTRTASGRINKTRASQHLGWDPATLTARLEDLALPDLATAIAVLDGSL